MKRKKKEEERERERETFTRMELKVEREGLMMISGIRLALRVAVRVVPRVGRGPSARYGGGCPTVVAACPTVVRGDVVGILGPERPQAEESGNGERDERREDRLLRYQADGEVGEGCQRADLHFRCDQEGQDRLEYLLLPSTWKRTEFILIEFFFKWSILSIYFTRRQICSINGISLDLD